MAQAPYLDKEEKKRLTWAEKRQNFANWQGQNRTSLARYAGDTVLGKAATSAFRGGITGLVRDESARATEDINRAMTLEKDPVMEALLFGREGRAATPAPLSEAPDPSMSLMDAYNENQQQHQRQLNLNADVSRAALNGAVEPYRQNPGKVGLTRIVNTKNADGTNSYSSVSDGSAGGEVRYYDQAGVRAGQLGDRYNNETLQPLGGYADLQNDDHAFADAMQQGATSMKWVDRVNGETAAAKAKAELEALPPEQRASLMRTQMTEQGQDRRTGATLQRQDNRLAFDQQGRQFDQQAAGIKADQVLQDREKADPVGAFNNLMGSFGNMPRDEVLKMMTDPNSAEGARAQALMQRMIGEKIGDKNVDLKTLTKTSKFRQALGGDSLAIGSDPIWKTAAGIDGVTDEYATLMADAMRILAARQ